MKPMKRIMDIQLNIQVWKDKQTNLFIAYASQLDVSSCGKTVDQARKNIKDAIEGFLESAEDRGTLDQILEEAGFIVEKKAWKAPEILLSEKIQMCR